MSKTRKRPGSIVGFWLSKRPNSEQWCRTWFDQTTRQTRRASLGTVDAEVAEQSLALWIAKNVGTKRAEPRDVSIARIFARYHERHGKYAVGGKAQGLSLAMILEAVPEGMALDEFTLDAQEDVVRRLRAKPYAAGTIKRGMGAAKAAINWAWRNNEIDRPVPFLRLPDGQGRERVLSIPELARLWDAEMPEHLRVFLALCIGTAGRPDALLQLTRSRCDIERGTINLNPAGRPQTKKRRPILPLPEWLLPWIERSEASIVTYRGKPVQKIAGAFQTLRDAAGFGPDVTAYTLRHTVATELAARGVPEMEIAAVLGHTMPNMRTTGRYVHVSPSRLAAARTGLSDIAKEIGRVAILPLDPSVLRASCVAKANASASFLQANPLITGAGEGIRTLDPNLGKVVLYP